MEAFFSCDPRSSACEWKSGVRAFTKDYNRLRGTNYRLEKCFDPEADNRSIPEVLLVTESGLHMVVEQKRIVWPENFLYGHSQWHHLAEHLSNALNNFFENPSTVDISSYYLGGLNKKDVSQVGESIVNQIKGGRQRGVVPCGSQGDMPWEIHNDVSDAPEGVKVVVEDDGYSSRPDPLRNLEILPRVQKDTIKGFQERLKYHLKGVEKKFARYSEDQKILLLQFIGEKIDIKTLQEETSLPQIFQVMNDVKFVNEVWIATKEWISQDDFRILWIPLWSRSPVTGDAEVTLPTE